MKYKISIFLNVIVNKGFPPTKSLLTLAWMSVSASTSIILSISTVCTGVSTSAGTDISTAANTAAGISCQSRY